VSQPTENGIELPAPISGARYDHAYFGQLRRKLRWQLLVVYVTPLLLLAFYFHYEYGVTLRNGIDNHLRSAAENRRNTVDLFLQERVANVRSIFRSEEFTLSPEPGSMDKLLADIRRESSTFVDLGLFGPDGRLAAYAGPHLSLLGKDYSGEEWFQTMLKQNQDFFISDVYLGFRNKPHFIVAVRRSIEDQMWIMRASVDPEKFGEFVGGSYLVQNAEAFIVNSRGQRQTFYGGGPPETEQSRVGDRTPETQVTEVEVGGKKYVRALAWLDENDWALVVRVPKVKAYAPLFHARIVLLAIMLSALLSIVMVVLRNTQNLIAKLEAADKTKEDLRLQLFNAAKLASVGEIAAGVAHEINNPLAIIYEEASMMEDIVDPQFGQNIEPADLKERFEAIKEAAMRGRSITGKLLAFARRHDPNPEPTDINPLLDRVLKVKEVDFKVSNIRVIRDYRDDLPPAMVNPNQMDQVILNLLNNAKDAMDKGGKITIRTRFQAQWVCIEVKDTGHGMPPEIMGKIFYPFFTTKGVGKGTGLGLSISYGIVESLGGRIEVESELGKGTTFTIYLPIKERIDKDFTVNTARGSHV
jgi:two-component system NtrC family sensor kinase